MAIMRRWQPAETDFVVEVFEDTVVARFRPTQSIYIFARFTTDRDIAEFGPVSPDPVVQHASRSTGTRRYSAAEVQAMAYGLAMAPCGAKRRKGLRRPRFGQPIEPMTLGNVRELGVRSFHVCWNCHHQAVLSRALAG
jgi:hypothetical protein